mgnify:CR=1 FL=1
MSEDYTKHYLVNDALCPVPTSGPRVLVGFWAIDDVNTGDRPEVTDTPLFTIMYPVGKGDEWYNWRHMTGDPLDPEHPNSANHIQWLDGHLSISQSTEFGGRKNLSILSEPTIKKMHWTLFQDYPKYIWGKIQRTYEIQEISLREECIVQFKAADGHFINLLENGDIVCETRVPNDACNFKVRFPKFTWNSEGGEGDNEGSFYLQASNGCYVTSKISENTVTLCANADKKNAELFTATMASNCSISLSTENQLTLQHIPPYTDLLLKESKEVDSIWAWFNVNYI